MHWDSSDAPKRTVHRPNGNENQLNVGDVIKVRTWGGRTKRMKFLGMDTGSNCMFQDVQDPKEIQFLSDAETKLFLQFGTVCSRDTSFVAEASRSGQELLWDAHWNDLEKNIFGLDSECSTSISEESNSVISVPVSDIVHDQADGTCYAHACATAIRAAEARIVGRLPQPFDELVAAIIAEFGNNGGETERVLDRFCPPRQLRYRNIESGSDRLLLDVLRSGRVLIASFDLREYQWTLLSLFFKYNPNGVLTKADFERDARRRNDFPPEMREMGGHAVVITGYIEREEKIIYKMKNSWGTDFANEGYFYVESDAFPQGFKNLVDVHFYVSDLPRNDISNFLLSLLRQSKGIKITDRTQIAVRGCSSRFGIVKADMVTPQQRKNFTTTEARAEMRIRHRLGISNGVTVSKSGRIRVDGTTKSFRVAVV